MLINRRATVSLVVLMGCTAAQPEAVGPIVFPEASTAVAVSSARFFSLDPDQSLNNSAMRNCRFGRTSKIPVVPALVELGLTSLKIGGQTAGALQDGALDDSHRAVLEGKLSPMASVSRAMAESACHPWRAGPEDASMVPTLLIAADARAPAASLDIIIDAAWSAGFDEVGLWMAAEGRAPAESGGGTPLTSAAATVAQLAGEVDQVRAGGEPCVLFQPGRKAGSPASVETGGAATQGALSQTIPILPLAREGNRRLVTGESCGSPVEQVSEELLDAP